MQAIQTRYFGPSNTRGSRIKAWCEAGSITIPYPHECDSGEPCHLKAAEALQKRLGWIGKNYGRLVGGQLPSGDFCFVMVPAVDALGHLIQWAAGNRGAKTGNPYSVPEVKDALKALQWVVGCADYLDSAEQYRAPA